MRAHSITRITVFHNIRSGLLFYSAVIVVMFGFFHISTLGGWDQSFYWAQLTSIWYDGDLTLHNDLIANYNPLRDQYSTITRLTQQGELLNTFSIGVALVDGLYSGPLLLLCKSLGAPRMNELFLRVVALATLCKIWLLLFALKQLLDIYDSSPSWKYATVLGSFLGLPIFYYAFYDYGMAHLNSGLFATLFTLAFIVWMRRPEGRHSLLLGISAGLMILTRWQNAIFALLVIPPLLYQLSSCATRERLKFLKGCGLVLLTIIVMGALQCAVFYKQFGDAFLMPQGEEYMRWSSPQWKPLLFSGYHGLLPWSPLVVVAVIGLLKSMFQQRGVWRWFMVGAILTIIATVYINACAADWWGGWAYGARRFCCLLPFVALGSFDVFHSLRKHAALVLFFGIVLWSHLTYTCYTNKIDDLAIPLLGKPSLYSAAGTAETSYWIGDPERARGKLQRNLPAPHYRALKLIPSSALNELANQMSSALILLTICWAMRKLFLAWVYTETVRKWAASGFLAYTIILTGVIVCCFPNSSRCNLPWKQYLQKQISAEEAIRQNLPREPVRLLAALSYVSQNRAEDARKALADVDTRSFRDANLGNLIDLWRYRKKDGGM